MDITLLSSLQTALLSKLIDHTRLPPQTMNSPHMLLTRKLCWLIVIALSNEKTEKPWGKTRLLQIGYALRQRIDREGIAGQLQSASSVLRQWAIKTQPLSNCVVRACAYQSARQRNMGIARNLATSFDDYLAKEGCLEDPFSKQTLRNFQPCVSTPKTPEQHKECVNQQNTVYLNSCPIFLSCNLGGTSHEQPWPWSCSVLENVHWKEMHQCLYFGLGGKMISKGIFLSNFWDLYML